MLPFLPHSKPIKHMLLYPVYRSEDSFKPLVPVNNPALPNPLQIPSLPGKPQATVDSCPPAAALARARTHTHPCFSTPTPRMSFPYLYIPICAGTGAQSPVPFLKNTESFYVPQELFSWCSLSLFPTPKVSSLTQQCISGSASSPFLLLLLLQPVFQDDTETSPRWWCCGRAGLISSICVPPSCLSTHKQPCSPWGKMGDGPL